MRLRRTRSAWLLTPLLLLAGCGAADQPQALEPIPGAPPADLCATIPASLREGLVTEGNTNTDGTPTAACSLRTPVSAQKPVTALVTWLQLDDEATADKVLTSQCRSVDLSGRREVSSFTVPRADEACAASGQEGAQGSATMAGVDGRQVVTVRWTIASGSSAQALERGRQAMSAVLGELTENE